MVPVWPPLAAIRWTGRTLRARRCAAALPTGGTFTSCLGVLDFRLAALRYAVGIAPVDDLFYTKPQEVPVQVFPVAAAYDLAERLRKARASWNRARANARQLDDWLECGWRQERVEARRERIDQIARAIRAGELSDRKEEP